MAGAFGSLRALGERQLQIQFTLSSMYDAQAMGILALNGVLVAAAIAAEGLLGHLWWLALIGFFVSSLPCIVALSGGGEDLALDIQTAFAAAATSTTDEMDQFLTKSINKALINNDGQLKAKRWLIAVAVGLFIATIIAAIASVLAF
jgi:hypothetical protein